jgi:hypothetical protein
MSVGVAVCSTILGVIFIFSAIPKLRHPNGFILVVLEYRILPPRLGRVFARLVPQLELFAALLLLSGIAVRLAGALTSLLLLSFIVAISINIARGRNLDCHCFGKETRRQIGWNTLVQDGALLGLSAITLATASEWLTPEPWSVLRLFGMAGAASSGPFLGCAAISLCAAPLLGQLQRAGRRYRRAVATR